MTDTLETPEIARIRGALAAGPTPGPWKYSAIDSDLHDKSPYTYVKGSGKNQCVFAGAAVTSVLGNVALAPFDYVDSPNGMTSQNASYIAACNPTAMISVLAHIDAQAAEIDRLRADAGQMRATLALIVSVEPRKGEDLACQPTEFERWAKSRANHAIIKSDAATKEQP